MPFITQGKTNLKYILIVVVLAVIVGGGILGYYYWWIKDLETKLAEIELRLPPKVIEEETANWKTYRNNFYHFQLNIPNDWRIEESKRPSGIPSVVISSPDDEIIIESPPEFRARYERTEITDVQVGKYNVKRIRYIIGQNILDGYIWLEDIPRQKPITIAFQIKGDTVNNDILFLEILKTFQYTQEEASLDELISYTVPSGWKKESKDPTKEISIASPDYKPSLEFGAETGTRIFIDRNFVGDSYTFQAVGATDDMIINIDDLEAVLVHVDNYNRGHHLALNVLQRPYLWNISIESPNLQEENKYREEIDFFISSIKFK